MGFPSAVIAFMTVFEAAVSFIIWWVMSVVSISLMVLFAVYAASWFISIAIQFLCLFRICVVSRALAPQPISMCISVLFIWLLLIAVV